MNLGSVDILILCCLFFLAWPLIAASVMLLSAETLWQGKIPVTNRPWWRTRAAQFEPLSLDPTSRDSVLCWMVAIRWPLDERLKHTRHPPHWPMRELWATTEAMILDIVTLHFLLESDGVPERLIIEKLEAWRSKWGEADGALPDRLGDYLRYRLSIEDPAYLQLPSVFWDAMTVAVEFARGEVERKGSERAFPPAEWLQQRMDPVAIDRYEEQHIAHRAAGSPALLLTPRHERDWDRMKLRMLPGDELWSFDSPSRYWQGMAGRRGIALVRAGRAIDHLITAMN
jgi:hypothetical protein